MTAEPAGGATVGLVVGKTPLPAIQMRLADSLGAGWNCADSPQQSAVKSILQDMKKRER
jgi:hypothetical protein